MTYSGFLIFALIEPAVLPKLVPVTVMVCASADPAGSGAVPVIDSIPGQRYLHFFAPLVFEFMFELESESEFTFEFERGFQFQPDQIEWL